MKRINFALDLEADLQAYASDNEKVDTALMSLEAMTSTQDLLHDGGDALDATTYRIVQNSMECFARLGRVGNPAASVLPDLQSHQSSFTISQATLEGVASGIKNVFMSIINAIKKAIQWMGGLIKKLFSRGKDHEGAVIRIESEITEVKEKIKKATPEELKAGPYPRDHDGWFSKVDIHHPEILKKLVTSKGIMKNEDIHKFTTEMSKVFQLQLDNVKQAMNISVRGEASDMAKMQYVPSLPQTHDASIIKKVSRDNTDKVYASFEFGGGEHIYIKVAAQAFIEHGREAEFIKETSRFIDGLQFGKTTIDQIPNYKAIKQIDDHSLVNVDVLLNTISLLSKTLTMNTTKLEGINQSKTYFIKDFESRIAKLEVGFFSSMDKKAERDVLMQHLKYFKKVMDQPAVMYYAACEQVVTAFEHLAMYILAFNRRNGNMIALKK